MPEGRFQGEDLEKRSMSTMTTTSSAPNSQAKRLVLLVWLLVGFFYFYLSWGYIRVTMDDQQFADYLQYVVNVAGSENRPSKEIRALIVIRAEQLSLPVRGDQIAILGGGRTLNVRVSYQVDIEFPVLQKTVYTKEFNHYVQYRAGN
jgi:hypothetical protein